MARSQQFFIGYSIRHALAAISIVVLSAVTSPTSLAQSALTPAAKEALQQGVAAAKFKDWDAAQKYFSDALAAAPGAPEVLFNLGLLNDRKGGAELVASAWYRAYLAAVPATQNRNKIEARLIELHASAEARAAKFLATAKEVDKQRIRSDCFEEGLLALVRGEAIAGHFESVQELADLFPHTGCPNWTFHEAAVTVMLVPETPKEASRDQEAFRYIEKIVSSDGKILALNDSAAAKMRRGDRIGAIQLVEKAEALANEQKDGWAHFQMVFAWSRVGDGERALRSFEKFDYRLEGTVVPEAYEEYVEYLIKGVLTAFLLSEKDKEAKEAIDRITSEKLTYNNKEQLHTQCNAILVELKSKSQEDLITLTEEPYKRDLDKVESSWSEEEFSSTSALEAVKIEQDYWAKLAWALSENAHLDGSKLLALASGSEAKQAVEILSVGAADLLLGSRKIKRIAEEWRTEGAGSAQ